ncbi:LysM peptidoglycan-binding domain-containing protein [Streptacidiphilus sp. 4-A2]|nr:LysM peptidoglycan-binding domain-containing protein [Streptacidiphilus sp. 4-A2]
MRRRRPTTPPAPHRAPPRAEHQHHPVNTSTTSYTVRTGDTLGAIASSHGTTWQKLYAANTGTIGTNPDLITPGQTLTLG